MSQLFVELTSEQQKALRHFAAEEGRNWKARLRKAWLSGRYPRHCRGDESSLQHIRNRHGTVWLGKVTHNELMKDEDSKVALYEENRRLQKRWDDAHARAAKLDTVFIKMVQERFEAGEIEVEMFEAALYSAENNRVEAFITLNEVPYMEGDEASIKMIYNNLAGIKFREQGWQTHAQYLDVMENEYGPLRGRTIALMDAKGETLARQIISDIKRHGHQIK